ncbi:MAG: hypothetical protein KDC88_15070 [Ignavibacteriae bacterium]|nr:hypothetical protein [Ignavibacteriota bacterium]
MNKTGTTSMEALFHALNIPVGPQRPAELLISDYANNEFKRIIKFVRFNGVAFQDIPFSLPKTYEVLDKAFPNSKFILTIRDSDETWYNSLISFNGKLFANGKIPTKENLQNAKYIYKGWMWQANRIIFKTPENDIYKKDVLIKQYNDYNNSVLEYFKNKPSKLLVVNVSQKDAAKQICQFLGTKKRLETMPWENKT